MARVPSGEAALASLLLLFLHSAPSAALARNVYQTGNKRLFFPDGARPRNALLRQRAVHTLSEDHSMISFDSEISEAFDVQLERVDTLDSRDDFIPTHDHLEGCAAPEKGSLVKQVLDRYGKNATIQLGDIAKDIQEALQSFTLLSHEVLLMRADSSFVVASHADAAAQAHCALKYMGYRALVYETPIQYDVRNVTSEEKLSSVDYGEPLGSSGQPGQHHLPSRQRRAPSLLCRNSQLGLLAWQTVEPLLRLNSSQHNIGDVARNLQIEAQNSFGKSFEVIISKYNFELKSHYHGWHKCKKHIGDYYVHIYATPVQYDTADVDNEIRLSSIDFGDPLGSSGYVDQPLLPKEERPSLIPPPPAYPDIWEFACTVEMRMLILQAARESLDEREERPNCHSLAQSVQRGLQEHYERAFEVIVLTSDFVVNTNFNGELACRLRFGDYRIVAYETQQQFRLRRQIDDDIAIRRYDVHDKEAEDFFTYFNAPDWEGSGGHQSRERRAPRVVCLDQRLGSIIEDVSGPFLSNNASEERLGDVTRMVQVAAQAAYGLSFETIISPYNFEINTGYNGPIDCKKKIGQYYVHSFPTSKQYDINNIEEEEALANVDFGERLGGSGFPGQPEWPREHLAAHCGPFEDEIRVEGRAVEMGDCCNDELRGVVLTAARRTLSTKVGKNSLARSIHTDVQDHFSLSFETVVSSTALASLSYYEAPLRCSLIFGDYHILTYATPVPYNISNTDDEEMFERVGEEDYDDFGAAVAASHDANAADSSFNF